MTPLFVAKCLGFGAFCGLIVVGLALWLTGLTEDDDVKIGEVWA